MRLARGRGGYQFPSFLPSDLLHLERRKEEKEGGEGRRRRKEETAGGEGRRRRKGKEERKDGKKEREGKRRKERKEGKKERKGGKERRKERRKGKGRKKKTAKRISGLGGQNARYATRRCYGCMEIHMHGSTRHYTDKLEEESVKQKRDLIDALWKEIGDTRQRGTPEVEIAAVDRSGVNEIMAPRLSKHTKQLRAHLRSITTYPVVAVSHVPDRNDMVEYNEADTETMKDMDASKEGKKSHGDRHTPCIL
jgi:hypothetical protein